MSTENISPFRQLIHVRYGSSCESFEVYTLVTNATFDDFEMSTHWSHHFLMLDLVLATFVSNYLWYHCFDVGSEHWSRRESGLLRGYLSILVLLFNSMVILVGSFSVPHSQRSYVNLLSSKHYSSPLLYL